MTPAKKLSTAHKQPEESSMEALVLIFAEIILACLMPLLALIASAIAAIFELLLLMIGIGTSRRKRKATAPSDLPRKPIIPRKAVH